MASVLRSQLLTAQGFLHGFSTRQGGVSVGPFATLNLARSVGDDAEHVAENLRRFAGAVGYAPEPLFELSQVHGRLVHVLSAHDRADVLRRNEGDALVARAGAAVGVRTADCLAVLLADPQSRRVAALHAGWRGLVAGVVQASVSALCEVANAPRAQLLAAVFPHIRVCCFEVGAEVADALASAALSADVVERSHEKPHVRLAGVLRAQLLAAGIAAQNIDELDGCTRCDSARFFSFRRDGAASGRHLAAIVAG
jgi:YfiH family protein